jgi:hypothetical protein
MKAVFLKQRAIACSLPLAAAAPPIAAARERGGVDVTRFHLGQPIARGQIAIEPFDRGDANSPNSAATPARSRAAEPPRLDGGEPTRPVRAGRADRRRAGQPPPPPHRPRRGAAAPRGRSRANVTATLLEVGIKRRSDGTVFWEGRAVGEARTGSAGARSTAAVERLPKPCFGTSPANRAALSGFDDPLHFERLRRRQHSPGRHRRQPHRPRNRQGPRSPISTNGSISA